MVFWLQNFSIVNGIVAYKFLRKYKKKMKINNRSREGLELEVLNNKSTFNFNKIIKDTEQLLNQVTSFYSRKFCHKNPWKAIKEINASNHKYPFKTLLTLFSLMIINVLILICYFLLTYVPSIYTIIYF